MWRKFVAMTLVLALPTAVSAGPLRDAAARAGRDLAAAQQQIEERSRARFWSGIALLAGGATLATLGGLEVGDDETGPDDGEDFDNSDDGEDSDGWGNKALLGGGIAAATVGGILLLTGRKGRKAGPVLSVRPGRVTVQQTIDF
jgi:hypothetical protein